MATLLDRLGRFAYRRPALVLSVWVAVLALLVAGAVTLHRPMASTVSIPGTESQQAIDLLQRRMPQASVGDATARIVFTTNASAKVTDAARMAAIERALHKVSSLAHIVAVVDPLTAKTISPDQHTAIATVLYDIQARQVTDAQRQALETAGRAAESAGVQVEFGGTAMSHFNVSHVSEIFALGIAALVLFITFGSLVAVGMPLVTAGAAIASSLLGIEIATRFVDLQSQSITLALDAGPRGRRRLRPVRRLPPPPRAHRRPFGGGVGRTGGRHRGVRGRVRRPHGHHRPLGSRGRPHSLPDVDGPGGGRRSPRRGAGGAHAAAGRARLRR